MYKYYVRMLSVRRFICAFTSVVVLAFCPVQAQVPSQSAVVPPIKQCNESNYLNAYCAGEDDGPISVGEVVDASDVYVCNLDVRLSADVHKARLLFRNYVKAMKTSDSAVASFAATSQCKNPAGAVVLKKVIEQYYSDEDEAGFYLVVVATKSGQTLIAFTSIAI